MQMQKKVTLKEDGRFLIYYHFGETATEEETAVFDAIVPIAASQAEYIANKEEKEKEEKMKAGEEGRETEQQTLTPAAEGSAHV